MIRAIEVYETTDGRRHDSEDTAREHVADLCREILSESLRPGQGMLTRLTANDVFSVVMTLVPDADAARALAFKLRRVMEDDR